MKNIALTVAFLFLATASASALETDDYGFPQWETAASGPVAPVVNWNNFPQPFANVRCQRSCSGPTSRHPYATAANLRSLDNCSFDTGTTSMASQRATYSHD